MTQTATAPAKPGVKTWPCKRCGENFKAGDWECKDGSTHIVEKKTYYVRGVGLTTYYGGVIREPGNVGANRRAGVITFQKGTYQTEDAQQQEYLDTYPACCSFEEWKQTHIPEKELRELEKRGAERLAKENFDLLAKVKQLEEEAATRAKGK